MTKLKASHISRSPQYELQEKSSAPDTIIETSGLVLEILASAASLPPIPLLAEAADLVLSLINIVQDLRDNKDQFKQLAGHAANLCHHAIYACSPYTRLNDVPTNLQNDLETFIRSLNPVKCYAIKKLKRGWLKRMVYRRHDAQVIRQYYNEMQNSLDCLKADIIKRLDHHKACWRTAERTGSQTRPQPQYRSPTVHLSPSSESRHRPVKGTPRSSGSPFGPGFPFLPGKNPFGQGFPFNHIGDDSYEQTETRTALPTSPFGIPGRNVIAFHVLGDLHMFNNFGP